MSQPATPPNPDAPYGVAPNGQPYSEKSKIVAGVLQLFLGGLGIGRFYTGHTGMAVAQLLTCGGLGLWALIDGIIFLVSNERTDKQGRVLRG
ncbi:TM2 domain-containing protein [Streptomyces sp. JJ36]|uniref:TM2 domain-containing protein n=1 Tax=Streptomyces sp. JJ36 TaxID=2736645 RepID=UPI001F393E11|nr:TM2 domain-containing protein [Streptomyces sp. JJ36]MCF6525001.1 TM2 domain-containing protein [Streptomyces sp. JJ36]